MCDVAPRRTQWDCDETGSCKSKNDIGKPVQPVSKNGDEIRAPLHGVEPVADELADVAHDVEAQLGDLMFLELGQGRLDRVEFREVERQGAMPTCRFCSSGQTLALRLRWVATPFQMICSGRLIRRLSAPRNSMIRSERMPLEERRNFTLHCVDTYFRGSQSVTF